MDDPCPYCGGPVVHRTGADIYPHRPDLHRGHYWACGSCDARVGCHPGTALPLGRLADRRLRRLRMRAHQEFDKIWKFGRTTRPEAYIWLRRFLCLRKDDAHIGMFDEATCLKLLRACREKQYKAFIRERLRRKKGMRWRPANGETTPQWTNC